MPIYCLKCRSKKIDEIMEGNRLFYSCLKCNTKQGKALIIDGKIKILHTSQGIKHISVAAIIIRDNKILLLERRFYHYGLTVPAGHLHYDETLDEALRRELYEEIGLRVKNAILLAQVEQPASHCRYGADIEEWAIYKVEPETYEPFVANDENESFKWVSLDDIPIERLTPHTKFGLTTLGYVKKRA